MADREPNTNPDSKGPSSRVLQFRATQSDCNRLDGLKEITGQNNTSRLIRDSIHLMYTIADLQQGGRRVYIRDVNGEEAELLVLGM